MLCFKMWSRNFIPDYGIKILSIYILLSLAAKSHVEGFVSCSPSPCKNGGTCLSTLRGEYFCNCTSRYAGEFCQHLNPCHSESSPRCQNGGTCRVRPGAGGAPPSFACDCPLGFSASLCEIRVPAACDSAPCLNGATCRLTSLHTYECDCPPGYTGEECSHEDHCASQPCRNGGRCVADNTTAVGYSCACPPGFTGARCTEDVFECSSGSGPCHHGRCFNTHGSYTCVCEPGYTGRDCDTEYVPCEPSPCLHGGRCTQLDSLRYECDCPTGYRGQNCEIDIDDCPGHLCQNGATCLDGLNSYTCECPPTYTGTLCETDVDECALRPLVCQNGATCTNSVGGFSCICVNGWTGPECSVNIDDCAGAACFNGATCIDRVGAFYCKCTPGKTGLLCHLDDACTSNPCHADAICDTSPINGSYTCSCASGYKGLDCSEDINECEQARMTDIENSSRHVSYEQVKQMIDFMGQHIEFASGSLRSLEARHTSKTLWNELTKILNNSKYGTKKTSDGWSKYWSDFKNKLKNKVNILKKRKRPSLSKHNIKPLSRLEKRALIILGPHFERKISKVSVDPFSGISSKESLPVVKLESYHENENEYHNQSDCSERHSDGRESIMSDESNEEFQNDSDGDSDAPVIQSIYPKWLIEIEKKRTDADLSRAKAEEQRALVSAKNADAALIQAEAMKKLAEAADKQAEALMKIANMLECRVQNMQPM